ncbi:hypothetical protein MADMEL_107 [Erwinia phage vB_EamM_MadMel]|uniref:Uncharacterized protein n=1 Tax=Erwinia phage vB_EamM_MadMel TaxID=2060128 RepID=A0A2H5BJS2_9CAUD|nr:hypothetical protein MADMEL_107 [Erwinia phage vB_EamM_MadMel]
MDIENKKILGLVLNDFVDMYMLQLNNKNRDVCINELNSGLCGVAAMCVGNVMRERYGATDIDWESHCLHMWLVLDGKRYDTLYPEGYDVPVVDAWLLKEQKYNSHVMAGESVIDIEDNSGYVAGGWWDCLYLIKGWYERYGMAPPAYVKRMMTNLRGNHLHRRERRAARRYQLVLKAPLPSFTDEVRTNTVLPMTHYWHGEFEGSQERVLARKPGMLSVKTYKSLLKYYREKGVPVTQYFC